MGFLRRRWPILAVSGAVIGIGAILLWPSSAGAAAAYCAKHGERRLTMDQAKAVARKWGRIRGIPPAWILGTMFVESRLDACETGDFVIRGERIPGGASVGIMQVNTVAHPDLMAKLGLTREDLFDPDKAVELGSYILNREYRRILAVLAGRRPPVPIGVIVQLGYKGNMRKILRQLQQGTFNAAQIHDPAVLARRSNALARAEALV